MSSRLEHDPHTAIGLLVHLDDSVRRLGLSALDVQEFVSKRLTAAGITLADGNGRDGCALGVEIQLESDGLCVCGLEFYRVQRTPAGVGSRHARGGAWRVTLMARADTSDSIRGHLGLLTTEFVRQYMEAN